MYINSLIFASFISLALSAAVDKDVGLTKRDPTCYGGKDGMGKSDELSKCLDNLIAASNWGDMNCGGKSWFLGREEGGFLGIGNWDSPGDCIGGCTSCLKDAASRGLDYAKCDQQAALAHCWVGYCPPGSAPCGNSDGSCCPV
ncbi:hypothetical protein B0O99DRAFT_541823 [Bisporella sp. PMI_857]|nr:hypothetical protein B0O99DRAFT_541823 [Bisporella sp. PMI_857]